MNRYVRAIPREKREDVAREQQRSKHAIRDASVEAAMLRQALMQGQRWEGLRRAMSRDAQVPAQCWYL